MKEKPYRAPVSAPAVLWICAAVLLMIAVYGFGFERGARATSKRINREIQHCICE